MTLLKSLFQISPIVKLDLLITSTLNNADDRHTLIFSLNRRPFNGLCTVFPAVGIAMLTQFQVNCVNFIDVDGIIQIYKYSGKNFQLHNSIKLDIFLNLKILKYCLSL